MLMSSLWFATGCTKDAEDNEPTLTEDEQIYALLQTETLYYYQNDTSTLNAAGNSPHGSFKLLFNQTAWDALGSDGKLATGQSFPSGSLVIKDVRRNGATRFYAAMWKQPSSTNAAEGWLWYEANLDGSLLESVTTKGRGCLGCHNGNVNRDFVNSFDLH